MKKYEDKLQAYILDNNIKAVHLKFAASCHSVQEASHAAGVPQEDFVKNICMVDQEGHLIVAIVKGEDRASTTRVGKVLNIPTPRTAAEEEILEKTGYPCGGVPSFGYQAIFLIDPRVMERETLYTGGGSPNALVQISSHELQKANSGLILRVRK